MTKRHVMVLLIVGGVSILPFITGVVSRGGGDSTLGTLIFTSAKVQAPLQEIRSYFISIPTPINKILFNYWTLTGWQYANNVIAHISTSFYFINGGNQGNNSIGTSGQWYLFELPLILIGTVLLWKQRKEASSKLLLTWIGIVILISGFTREPPQATRTFFLIFPMTLCSGLGLLYFTTEIQKIKSQNLKYAISSLILIVICWYILFYLFSYYLRFPIYYAKHWRTADRDVSMYLHDHQQEYNKIIIDEDAGFMYTSLLAYLPYPPGQFQMEQQRSKEDSEGFTHPVSFGKYEIKKIGKDEIITEPNTLIITTPDKSLEKLKPLMTFYYPERPIVLNIGQEIARYPVKDKAFTLFTTGAY